MRLEGQFEPGRPDAWPATCVHLSLSAAALVKHGITLECHAVLPWNAPPEVQRRARLEGITPAAAAAMAPPRLPLPQPTTIQAALPAPTAPALKSNKHKGQYGEHTSDAYLHAQRHEKLSDGGILAPLPPVPARGTGIDSVWKHHAPPPDYIIVEAKYGSSQLGHSKDGKQMSDSWILGSRRLNRAVDDDDLADDIIRAMGRKRVEKRLHHIASDGTLTETVLI